MESQIQLSSEFEDRELEGLTPLLWSPAGMPGMWVLSFFTCVSEGVSSPIPTTTPPLVLIIAVYFNLLRFHEEERQRQHLSPATAALSSSEGSVLSQGGGNGIQPP